TTHHATRMQAAQRFSGKDLPAKDRCQSARHIPVELAKFIQEWRFGLCQRASNRIAARQERVRCLASKIACELHTLAPARFVAVADRPNGRWFGPDNGCGGERVFDRLRRTLTQSLQHRMGGVAE